MASEKKGISHVNGLRKEQLKGKGVVVGGWWVGNGTHEHTVTVTVHFYAHRLGLSLLLFNEIK